MSEEKVSLVDFPYVHNAIVEMHNLNVPLPINPVFAEVSEHVDLLEVGRQCCYIWENREEADIYFNKLFKEKVIPEFYKNKLFRNDYVTIPLEKLIKNIEVTVGIVRDDPNWEQRAHEDCRTMILAAVIHLEDTDRGTHFHGRDQDGKTRFIAPTQKFSGSAWANMTQSYHSVPKGEKERYAYIVNAFWKTVD
jgi:hypothetical protein